MRAALQCAEKLATLDRIAGGVRRPSAAQRIGLNSGEALVGNIGSRRRFNYTVMGDMVNLASRLEGANKLFGTTIIASEATVALTGRTFSWRELDAIRVKGRSQAVKIYEPLGESDKVPLDAVLRAQSYSEALACYRARDFAGAAAKLSRFATDDPPAARLSERARQLAQNPPGPDWEPVNTLDEK